MAPHLVQSAPLGFVLLGFVLGMKHATDADHVIAVTTIVSRERRISAATLIGAVWGLGHTITILAVGGAIILLRLRIPPHVATAMEFAVALMLVLLGVLTLAQSREGRSVAHSHRHSHGGVVHSHPHGHLEGGEQSHDHLVAPSNDSAFARGSLWRALGVGVVHGMAGSAGIALLVLGAIADPRWAIAYLAIFGLGTVLGMVAITTAIGVPITLTALRMAGLNRKLAVAAGVLSVGFGIFLAIQIAASGGSFGFQG